MKNAPKKRTRRTTALSAHAPGVFDDALPSRLADTKQKGGARHVPIVRTPHAPVRSPYVIQLSRDDAPRESESVHDALALAQSLVFDGGEDDALPVSCVDDVLATPSEIRAQLREEDMERNAYSRITVSAPIERTHALSAPAHIPVPLAPVTPEDIHALLLAVDAEDDATDVCVTNETLPIVSDTGFSEETIAEEPIASKASQPLFTFHFSFFSHNKGLRRALAGFIALSFLVVLPLHAMQALGDASHDAEDISAVGRAAVDDLTHATSAFADARYAVAQDEFSRAAEKFAQAQDELDAVHGVITTVVNVIPQTDRTYDAVAGLIHAGQELSTVASIMTKAAESIAPKGAIDIVTKLELLSTAAEDAVPHANAAVAALANVDPAVIPAEYAEKVTQMTTYVPELAAALNEFTAFSNALATMLGGDGAMRYIVAFQNQTELRPTGGFIGSFAEIDVHNGVIADMRVPEGGTYDVQGQLGKFVASPSPLALINPRWELQDANWFPDFPSSARKIQWFYENAGGPTTDGVIAINAQFVVDLLTITGPIDMPEYGVTIDAENFMFEAQKAVELTYDKVANTPKAFIADLAPRLLEKMTAADMPTFLSMLDLVGTALAQKDIQVYFTKDSLQAAAKDLNWTGEMKQTSGDYLMVVNTNLGGGKTDTVIDQAVDVDVVIRADGTVENTVTITKTHHGIANALFTGRNNVDYLRLYVPEGSELLAADGFEAPPESAFEVSDVPLTTDADLSLAMSSVRRDLVSSTDIWNENGKTVFGNWMQTAPGETQTVRFTYRLPFTVTAEHGGLLATAARTLGVHDVVPYTLFLQKQAGAATRVTNIRVHPADMFTTAWSSDASLTSTEGRVVSNAEDQFFRLVLEEE